MPPVQDTIPNKYKRPDHDGDQRSAYLSAKKKIFASQDVCGICGKPVNKLLKFPHPLSKTVDHIIPVAKGGHPSDINNLQLAHWCCNRQKSDKLAPQTAAADTVKVISNRVLPHTFDWKTV